MKHTKPLSLTRQFFQHVIYLSNKRYYLLLVLAGVELHFLHNGWHGTGFWICAEQRVDNTEIFLLLLGLHRTKAFSAMLVKGLGVCGRLGGDTADTN